MPQPLTDEALAAMAAGVELETETSEEAAAAPAATPAATVAPAADQAEALAALIAAHEAAIADLKTQHEAALTAVTSRLEKFVDIARNSVKTMGIHFGVKADAVASMDADQILAEHTRLADLFKTKFKVGGVAATTPEVVPKAKASAPPMFAALLKSTAK
jgi:hypothetical protein